MLIGQPETEVEEDRSSVDETVDTIENPAMPRQSAAGVLDVEVSFDRRHHHIPDEARRTDQPPRDQCLLGGEW